ncbi:MAG: Colicin V production protein [Chloroflexi bacterium ADurb.Bin180]|nr:MAG: Colicin V production protein [Chloroflexi bacterium ADurb.Bin180]HNR97106.1 hypothetical protein [Anaerolineae bacterium]HQJ51415.1 hypothetical protein [Anaerolineae bacterium]
MTSPFTVIISYDQMVLLIMALFMFVGAMRGFSREVVTSVGLVVLLALLAQPALAGPVVDYLSRLVRLVLAFFQSHFSVDPDVLLKYYQNAKVPFSSENPYAVLICALVAFVLLSYGTRGHEKEASALGRLLGGVFGLLNGFLVITLFKEYVIQYLLQRSPTVAAAGRPAGFSVAVQGVPTHGGISGGDSRLLLGVVVALMVIVLARNLMKHTGNAKKGSA